MSANQIVQDPPAEGDTTLSVDEAQEALDAALHDVHESADEAGPLMEALEVLEQTKATLEGYHLELQASLESSTPNPVLIHAVQECLRQCHTTCGALDLMPERVDLESFEPQAQIRMSMEDVASSIAAINTWLVSGTNKLVLNIQHFFAGTQRVSQRAMDVLAHADRLIDQGTEPTTKQLSLSGAAAKALQAGKRKVTIREAVEIVERVGKETTDHWVPGLIKYAHDMSDAFGQSDLTKLRDTTGLTKRGFMERTKAFATIKPMVPSFCSIEGDHRFFFKMFRDVFKQTSSSEPLPGNRVVEVIHPVGDLAKYLDREDIRGYFETFPHWLLVDVDVRKVSGAEGNSMSIQVPSASELRQDIASVRSIVKEVRQLSVKSDEVKHAMQAMLDAYESHVYKRWDGVVDKIRNLTVELIPTVHVLATMYGHLAMGSSAVMYQTILQMGKYLSTECHGLATVALKCAKTYKPKGE